MKDWGPFEWIMVLCVVAGLAEELIDHVRGVKDGADMAGCRVHMGSDERDAGVTAWAPDASLSANDPGSVVVVGHGKTLQTYVGPRAQQCGTPCGALWHDLPGTESERITAVRACMNLCVYGEDAASVTP